MNITFENFNDSSFVSGYIKMKSAIIAKWYPNATAMRFTVTKCEEETYEVKGIITFTNAVTESIGQGESPIQAVDNFINVVDPTHNTIPPVSKAVSGISM